MPDTIKFVTIVGSICAVILVTVWAFASFPPSPTEITRELPFENVQQQ